MRVLCVGNVYPPHDLRGGYERVWRSAVEHVRAAGHTVRVLASDHRQPEVGPDDDHEVFRELRWYWRDYEFPPMSLPQRLRLERHNGRVLGRHLAQLRPDVIAWWAMGGMSLSLVERVRRSGLPAVGFVHDYWPVYGPDVDGWMRCARARPWVARPLGLVCGVPARCDFDAAARWLFVSEATREAVRGSAGWRAPDSGVAHSGIDEDYLAPPPQREWGWRLLCVGRVEQTKGVDVAIAALAELPGNATLTVIGAAEPDYLRSLKAEADGLGVADRVEFAGGYPPEAIRAAYADADAVLFPVRWHEPWGLVPLEAMGMGRSVVASGRGGSAEYLVDGANCLLCDVEDPRSLADAVRRLADDPALRARLRAGGAEAARTHTQGAFNATVLRELEAAARTVGE